jgi:hypothetical protein
MCSSFFANSSCIAGVTISVSPSWLAQQSATALHVTPRHQLQPNGKKLLLLLQPVACAQLLTN